MSGLEKRRPGGDLVALCSALSRGSTEGVATLCSNDPELCQGKVRLGVRENSVTVRVAKHWNRLPREVADAPCQSAFKRHLDNSLTDVL